MLTDDRSEGRDLAACLERHRNIGGKMELITLVVSHGAEVGKCRLSEVPKPLLHQAPKASENQLS
jgi:hypothetical protein